MTALRLANLNDLEELQTLFTETINRVCKHDYSAEEIKQWTSSTNDENRWKGFISNQYFLIAEYENKIIGFCSLKDENHLDLLYIHKDYQKMGIASLLYHEIKKESKRLGHKTLTADVSITAKSFFETKDFKIVREKKNLINGLEVINYQMSQ